MPTRYQPRLWRRERQGEYPGSNPGAPISSSSAKASEHGRKTAQILAFLERSFARVRGCSVAYRTQMGRRSRPNGTQTERKAVSSRIVIAAATSTQRGSVLCGRRAFSVSLTRLFGPAWLADVISRETRGAAIEQAEFQIETFERFRFSPAVLPADPHILGVARRRV